MLLAISDLSSRIVERFDRSWGYIGWGLWAAKLVYPYILLYLMFNSRLSPTHAWVYIPWTLYVVWLFWWLIDVIDQQVALWQVAVGVVMLLIGFLPLGGLLPVACWIIYWTRVRE